MRDSEGRNPNGHFRYNSQKWVSKSGAPAPFSIVSKEDGPRPRWVDCTGEVAGGIIGMTLMSHPANPKNEWYAREFGLMIVSAAQTVPLRFTAEKPFEFAARYVAHDGPLSSSVADDLHAAFAQTTATDCRKYLEG